MKKSWYIFPTSIYEIGDTAPSGTCRLIASFTPKECVTGAGDETPSNHEALENVLLAVHAPEMLEALQHLLACPALDVSGHLAATWDAIAEARHVIEAASPPPPPPPAPPPPPPAAAQPPEEQAAGPVLAKSARGR